MSFTFDTIKNLSWFALFRFISQIFSWVITIITARLLMPEDYGLMEMATIFTGYAALFSEMGFGAAIVQKPETSRKELSSVFWFAFFSSILFAVACIGIAYPTALIFHENRIVPITQTVSIVFLLNGLAVVPANILRKNMQFKKLGIIEMNSVIISSSAMICIAYMGGGVWTFICGNIVRDIVKTFLYYRAAAWVPSLHFSFLEAKQYLRFGLAISLGNSFRYVSEKSDRFFASINWSVQSLGLYSFALELAEIPSQKIGSIINQISFAALSKKQHSQIEFNKLYLDLNKISFSLVAPLYLGGFWVSDELFAFFLGDKWIAAIFFFKALCLAQIIKCLAPLNFQVHAALGQARLFLYLRASNGLLLFLSFFFTIRFGSYGIILPWFTTYPLFFIVLIGITLKRLNIPLQSYLGNLCHPFVASVLMSFILYILQELLFNFEENLLVRLCAKIMIGGLVYIGYFALFDKELISKIRTLRRTKNA